MAILDQWHYWKGPQDGNLGQVPPIATLLYTPLLSDAKLLQISLKICNKTSNSKKITLKFFWSCLSLIKPHHLSQVTLRRNKRPWNNKTRIRDSTGQGTSLLFVAAWWCVPVTLTKACRRHFSLSMKAVRSAAHVSYEGIYSTCSHQIKFDSSGVFFKYYNPILPPSYIVL